MARIALNSGAASSGLFSFKYSAALRLWDSISCWRLGLDWEKHENTPGTRNAPSKTATALVLISQLYGGRVAPLVGPTHRLRTAAVCRRRPYDFFDMGQNEMRAFSWNARGPIVVEVMADELVGVPFEAKLTPVFGLEKLGWLNML
jgi:hypothetical protein